MMSTALFTTRRRKRREDFDCGAEATAPAGGNSAHPGGDAAHCRRLHPGGLLVLRSRRAGKDIIAGTFFICGLGAEDFTDLSDDLAEKYEKLFRYPQAFARVPNGILVISENGRTEIIR